MSVLWVLVALVVSGVVGRQRRPVDARVVEGTAAFVPAAALHHEVTAHGSAGHIWAERDGETREGRSNDNRNKIRDKNL